jgi:hypothetical protein
VGVSSTSAAALEGVLPSKDEMHRDEVSFYAELAVPEWVNRLATVQPRSFRREEIPLLRLPDVLDMAQTP